MSDWVYYAGGPKGGLILLGKIEHDGYFLFRSHRQPDAYYRLTGETRQTTSGPVPIAEYTGTTPPGRQHH